MKKERGTTDGGQWPEQTVDEAVGKENRNSDFYHATEHLAVASKAAYGDSDLATAYYKRWRNRLLTDDGAAQALSDDLLELAQTPGRPAAARKILKREAGYFHKRADNMQYALPMTVCEDSSGGGSYGTTMTFSGLMVFNATAEDGFSLRGQIPFPTDGAGGYDSLGCSNWWTDARSDVKRSIFMDDYVYAISDKLLKVAHLDDLGTDIASIPVDN